MDARDAGGEIGRPGNCMEVPGKEKESRICDYSVFMTYLFMGVGSGIEQFEQRPLNWV